MNRITKALADTTSRLFFRDAEVAAVTEHGPDFRSIELVGDALKGVTWNVGDKVQVRADPDGFATRTYTPITWDADGGATSLMAYVHGDGPGSTWARTVAAGDPCQLFGPRGSLKLADLVGPVAFVGDETSFALAAAWRGRHPDAPPVAELFEVTDAEGCGPALDALGLASPRLFPRSAGATHLDQLSGALAEVLDRHDDAVVALTGRAQTIAALRRGLKDAGLADRPVRVKAYWDENRSGLD